jgi:hypothetical protein
LKKSPFKADRNHIHHRFIQSGFSHVQTTAFIVIINLIIIIIAFKMLYLNLNTQIGLLLIYGPLLFYLPFLLKRSLNKKKNKIKI